MKALYLFALTSVATLSPAATTVFDQNTGAIGDGNNNINNATYSPADAATRSNDIVHVIDFNIDSSAPYMVNQWYGLFEAGGGGTGTMMAWRPTARGAFPSLGPGTNHIISSEIAFTAGAGNSDPIIIPLNYTFSSSNARFVAAWDRQAGNVNEVHLFAQSDRGNFSSSVDPAPAFEVRPTNSTNWNGGDTGEVGGTNGNVQSSGPFGGVPADLPGFPAITYTAHWLDGTSTGNRDIDFTDVDDTSSSMYAFGFIDARIIPEPSRALLIALGAGLLVLRRRR